MPWHKYSNVRQRTWLLIALVSAALPAAGAEPILSLQSGPEKVAMLELYTSQGCSSCPPAEAWLSGLKTRPELWKEVVPMAFHVDYWDYIGWRDPFAKHEFGLRQRQYAVEGGARVVYTPALLLDGKEWRGWTGGTLPQPATVLAGTLSVERNAGELVVNYTPVEQFPNKLQTSVALLGFGVTSNVKAGENRGRKLANDFIVLDVKRRALNRDGATYSATLKDFDSHQDIPRLAIAAWVSEVSKQAPLQAVGGWQR